jgi:orotate phosphoribosyltransferase-like protein
MNYLEEIKELKKRKLNNGEIAEHLGITKSQVRKLLNDEYEELSDSSYTDADCSCSYSNDDSEIGDIISTMRGQSY